jgi:hypothetical protein
MKDLKFKINRTKKQRANLTPATVKTLQVIKQTVNWIDELVYLVKDEKNYYRLLQNNLNEFSLKKIIDINKVDLENIDEINIDNMVNHTTWGTVSNYFSKPYKVNL